MQSLATFFFEGGGGNIFVTEILYSIVSLVWDQSNVHLKMRSFSRLLVRLQI